MELPWIEKYRPKVLEDIAGNTEIINEFKIYAKEGNLPHLILSGKPGTGKTTSIICLAKTLLGDKFSSSFIELNASDERGIDVVRSKIKTFCLTKQTLPPGRHKIIFLDEVDSMTSTAQQALRRIIELYTHSTRFVMACNNSSKIIEAIQSRCAPKKFSPINYESMKKRFSYICEQENVPYTEEALKYIYDNSYGDMRKALNYLQPACTTYHNVHLDTMKIIIDSPNNIMVDKLLKTCLKGNIDKAYKSLESLVNQGYSSLDIIQSIFQNLKTENNIVDQNKKLKIISELGKVQIYLLQGCDNYLQLYSLISRIILIINDS